MKAVVKLLFVAIFCGAALGCKSVDGALNVVEKIQLSKGKKRYEIAPGKYDIELKVINSSDVRLTINADDKIKLVIPVGKDNLNKTPGEFYLTAAKIGQPYNLEVKKSVVKHQGNWHEIVREPCDLWVRERVCRIDANGNRVCRDENVRRDGFRRTEYAPVTIYETVEANFIIPDTELSPAALTATEITQKRIIVSQDECVLR